MSALAIAAVSAPLTPPQVWLSYGKALALCGRTPQWMSQQLRDGAITFRHSTQRLANGRHDRECLLSSLPADAQKRYAVEQAKLAAPVQASLPLFGVPQLVKPADKAAVKLMPHQTSDAARKHAILEPIFAMADPAARRQYALSFRLSDGAPVNSQNRMIAYMVEQQAAAGDPVSVPTIKRWLAAHKTSGIAGLAKQQRSDAGGSRFFQQPENARAAALVAMLYLGDGVFPGLSVQQCHEMLVAQREAVGLAEADVPHYQTVRRFLGQASPALKAYALKSREEFAGRMLPYLSRAYNEYANQVWVSDTMIADVEVMNDCIPGAKLGEPIRLRLTAILDYRSRYLVGYSWAWEGSSASIASALRMAVTQHGPCELWYADNGKDYRKVAKGALPGYMMPGSVEAEDWCQREMASIEQTGILARLGIRSTACIVRHPQSKHVERFFRTLHLTFCKLWPTYTGGKPSERPDQTSTLMMVHRRALAAGDLSRSHHPLASDFIAAFEAWVRKYHAHRGHRGQGMNFRSPAEVFAAERNPKQRPAPSIAELAYLLWEHTTRRVSECQVRLDNASYVPTDEVSSRVMFELNERDVVVAFDPLNRDFVAILDQHGRLLAMLQRKVLVRMAPDDPETQRQIAEMQQRRGSLVRDMRERRTAIVRAGKGTGAVHPLQLLGAAAAANTVVPAERITARKPRLCDRAAAATVAPTYTGDLAERMFARQRERKQADASR